MRAKKVDEKEQTLAELISSAHIHYVVSIKTNSARIWLSLHFVCMEFWFNVQPLSFFLRKILRMCHKFECNHRNHHHNQGQMMRTDPSISTAVTADRENASNKLNLSALITRAISHYCACVARTWWGSRMGHTHMCVVLRMCVFGAHVCVCVCVHK